MASGKKQSVIFLMSFVPQPKQSKEADWLLDIFTYISNQKQSSCKKGCDIQKVRVKKDVKSKVAAKK